jgi:hypothetical protein
MTQQLQLTLTLCPALKNTNNNNKKRRQASYYSLFNKGLQMSGSVIMQAGAQTSKWAPVTGEIIDFIQPVVCLL